MGAHNINDGNNFNGAEPQGDAAQHLMEAVQKEQGFDRMVNPSGEHHDDVSRRALLMNDTPQFEANLNNALMQLPGAQKGADGLVTFDSNAAWSPEQIRAVTELTKQLDERATLFQNYTKHIDKLLNSNKSMDNYMSSQFLPEIHRPGQ